MEEMKLLANKLDRGQNDLWASGVGGLPNGGAHHDS